MKLPRMLAVALFVLLLLSGAVPALAGGNGLFGNSILLDSFKTARLRADTNLQLAKQQNLVAKQNLQAQQLLYQQALQTNYSTIAQVQAANVQYQYQQVAPVVVQQQVEYQVAPVVVQKVKKVAQPVVVQQQVQYQQVQPVVVQKVQKVRVQQQVGGHCNY